MSESRVRENLMHGLMRGKRAKPSNLLYKLRLLYDKSLRQDAHLAEMKYMLRIPLGREECAFEDVCKADAHSAARTQRRS